MIKLIKNSKGYVSIETIVIAGLVIGIGVVAIMLMQSKSNQMLDKSLNNVDTAKDSAIVNNPWK